MQPQNHGLNLTTILPLQSTAKLLMIIFTEMTNSLLYNLLKTQN